MRFDRRLLVFAGVAFVVALALAPCLTNEPVWDDADLTVNNPYIASMHGFLRLFAADMWMTSAKEEPSNFYRPLAMASYAMNRLVLGNSSASYHAGNVLLHAANAALLAWTLVRLKLVRRVLPAVLAALAFGLAPLSMEAVTWLAGRFDLLGTTLVLAAMLANAREKRRFGAAALAVGALLCKETFVVAPVILVAADVFVHRRTLRAEAAKYGLAALGFAAVLVVRKVAGVITEEAFTHTAPGALVASYAFLLTTYARELVWPTYLDPFRHYVAPAEGSTALAVFLAVASFGGAALLDWKRRDDSRAGALAFGLAWTFVALAPASVTGPHLEMVGDRYAYCSIVGVAIAMAALVDRALGVGRPRRASIVVIALGVLVLFRETVRSRARLGEWRNDRTLCLASVRDDPTNFYAVYSLGQLDAVEGRFATAEGLLVHAAELRPGYWRTENALCFVWLRENRLGEAERACVASVQHNPLNSRTWLNLMSTYVRARDWVRCLEVADRTILAKPQIAEPRYLRAVCRANTGDLAGARSDVRDALDRDARHAGALDLAIQLDARGVAP